MEALPHIALNVPGALGIDARVDVADADTLACQRLRNLDIWPGTGGQGTRVRPRAWLRRYGQRVLYLLVEPTGSGSFVDGTYSWAYKYTDGNGVTHWSRLVTTTVSGSVDYVTLSGWPTAAGTVDIYRTVDAGSQLKLVTAALDVTANSSYDDSTADGSLGADGDIEALFDPMGNDSFDQTALCDWIGIQRSTSDAERILRLLVRSAGTAGASFPYSCFLDRSGYEEYLREGLSGVSPGTQPASVATLGDKVWIARSGSSIAYLRGGLEVEGATQPSQPSFTITQAAGTLTAVTDHIYVVQAVDTNTGIKSVPSAPVSAGGPYASKVNRLTGLSAGTYDVYRTSDGGQFFQFVKRSTIGTGSVISDELADASLGLETVPFDVGAAGGCRFIFAHKGILFAGYKTSGTESSSLLRWSNSLQPFNFPDDALAAPEYEFELDPDDGDELTAGVSYGEVAIVFKKRKVYQVSGDPPKGFRWTPVMGSHGRGCVAKRSIVETPVGLFYLSPQGPCLMVGPGAPPQPIGDKIRDRIVEVQRLALRGGGHALTVRAGKIGFSLMRSEAAAAALHVQVQLDAAGDFATPDFDYQTDTAGERPYFQGNHADWPAAGYSLASGRRVWVELTPPTSGGPTAGTAYSVRYRVDADGAGYGAWTTLSDTFTPELDDPYPDALDWDGIDWAFSVHYAARQEVWFFVPTGGRYWADTAWVCNYGAMLEGGEPLWRDVTVCATAGVEVEPFGAAGENAQRYLLLASPDGILFRYPDYTDGIDHSTREPCANFTGMATVSGATLTDAGAAFETDRYGLAGMVVAVQQANGEQFTGLITANTGTALTCVWLAGRSPTGSVDYVIGGLDVFCETAWLQLGAPEHLSILRHLTVRAGLGAGNLDVGVRAAQAATPDPLAGTVKTLAMPTGGHFDAIRRTVNLRGRVHAVRYGSIDRKQRWEIEEIGLAVETTEARR